MVNRRCLLAIALLLLTLIDPGAAAGHEDASSAPPATKALQAHEASNVNDASISEAPPPPLAKARYKSTESAAAAVEEGVGKPAPEPAGKVVESDASSIEDPLAPLVNRLASVAKDFGLEDETGELSKNASCHAKLMRLLKTLSTAAPPETDTSEATKLTAKEAAPAQSGTSSPTTPGPGPGSRAAANDARRDGDERTTKTRMVHSVITTNPSPTPPNPTSGAGGALSAADDAHRDTHVTDASAEAGREASPPKEAQDVEVGEAAPTAAAEAPAPAVDATEMSAAGAVEEAAAAEPCADEPCAHVVESPAADAELAQNVVSLAKLERGSKSLSPPAPEPADTDANLVTVAASAAASRRAQEMSDVEGQALAVQAAAVVRSYTQSTFQV